MNNGSITRRVLCDGHPRFRALVAVFGWLLGAGMLPGAEPVPIPPPVPLALTVPAPPLPVTWRGNDLLAYELHIGDFRTLGLELVQVEVLSDDRDGKRLTSLAGDGLARCLRLPDKVSPDYTVFLWVTFKTLHAVPAALYHRVTFRYSNSDERLIREGARTVIDPNRHHRVLSPPLRGGPWYVGNGPQNQDHHHRWSLMTYNGSPYIAQRFGIDWIKLGPNGLHYRTNGSTNEDWYGYGEDLLAVADGVVVDAKDGIPDNLPNQPPVVTINSQTAGGNFVLLDIGDGYFAFYAHLIPGSKTVQIGDRVTRGEVLGRLGNAGASTGPHLHFHLYSGRDPLFSEGVPYAFERYLFLGTAVIEQPWHPSGSTVLRVDEMPVDAEVLEFLDDGVLDID